MKLIKKLKKWKKERLRKNTIDNFDEYLYHILRYIYIKRKNQFSGTIKGVNHKELLENFSLNEEDLNSIMKWEEQNGLLKIHLGGNFYSIEPRDGLKYILDYKKIKTERKHNKIMIGATIAIALSAVVNLIDLLMHNPDTRTAIFEQLSQTLLVVISMVILAFTVMLIIALFIKTYEFAYNRIVKRQDFKKIHEFDLKEK